MNDASDTATGPSRRTFLRTAGVVGAAGALVPTAVSATGWGGRTGRHLGTPLPFRSDTAVDRMPHPLVVGHRGASGYRPEHTEGAYVLAAELGADVIEAGDLVPSKDGHLLLRHENDISETTDIADHDEFADRRTTKTIDGVPITGWFTEDFTLAELKTLRAKERLPDERQHNTVYDGRWPIMTLQEAIDLARQQSLRFRRQIWLHIETKHPTYFRSIGLPLEERLATTLRRNDLDGRRAPVFLQSFEPSSIQRLADLVDTPRVVLLSDLDSRPYDFVAAGDPRTVVDLITPEGLSWIASYADGIGPTATLILPLDADGNLTGETTSLVRDAHRAHLWVHSYTLRAENAFLPVDLRRGDDPAAYGDVFQYTARLWESGIDGIFTDNPDVALAGRDDFWAAKGVN